MISRTSDKLEDVKQEVLKNYPRTTIEYITCDFSNSHANPDQFYVQLNQQLNLYEISVLINNVGYADRKLLINQKDEDLENQLSLNLYPQTMLSYHLIPKFIARWESNQKRSLVIDLSSVSALTPNPVQSVYSATKIYDAYLSEALGYEYEK